MIYIVQLEELKERYTSWWSTYLPDRINSFSPCISITAESLSDTVKTGTVLDAGSTCFYKAGQLKEIAKLFYEGKIEPGDHFLICDIWYPGIEMIRYMSHLYDIPVSVWGVWHAGSSTMNDFAQPMHYWSRHFEIGFLNMCDGIFVGSDYSKGAIVERLLYALSEEETQSIADRIYSYGMPLDFNSLQQYGSEERTKIIFPHRPDNIKSINNIFWNWF